MRVGTRRAITAAMRRFALVSLSLLVAGCATSPRPVAVPQARQSLHGRGQIVGLTAEELVARFGTPALQISEGNSLKLQFRRGQCVLDAYLYPSGHSSYEVAYVDSRTPALARVDQAFCISSLEAR